ncbi:MAG: hypothetical protein AAF456_10030 [Planctomycetota bacterium]
MNNESNYSDPNETNPSRGDGSGGTPSGNSRIRRASWRPGWHELDQPVATGQMGEFEFFADVPESMSDAGTFDLVFFNQLKSDTETRTCSAKVVAIEHPELGPLERIDTCGLDYIFVKGDGEQVVVDAEEDPGSTASNSVNVTDWSVVVTLEVTATPDDAVA